MAITKCTLSCLCSPWTHCLPPPLFFLFPPTHQRKAPGILYLSFYTQERTHALRDFSLTCNYAHWAWQPSGLEGLSIKASVLISAPSMSLRACPMGLRGPGCLVRVLEPWKPLLSVLLHHQLCLQLIASLYWQLAFRTWHGVSQSWVSINEMNTRDTNPCRVCVASLAGILAWRVSHSCPSHSPFLGDPTFVALVQAVFSYFMYISLFPIH